MGEEMTFFCGIYNPEDGSFQIRKTETSMEDILLAKCKESQSQSTSSSPFPPAKRARTDVVDTSEFELYEFRLHGITGDSVAIGHVKFSWKSGGSKKHCSTAFAVDLNTMLDNRIGPESARTLAAFKFPLKRDIMTDMPYTSSFCPYYRSSDYGYALAGLLEYEGEICPETATIHSFPTALKWSWLDKEDKEDLLNRKD